MRWHVAALTAVWLIVLSWSSSMAQPVVNGQPDLAQTEHYDARTTSSANNEDELWNLIEESSLSESAGDGELRRPAAVSEGVYYIPFAGPIKRFPANIDDESILNWPVNPPGRSKRQSHFGSVGGHHFGGQMPQLSISSPIEALRNRLRLEMSRRLDNQIKQNQKLLESVGKRRKRHYKAPPAYGTDEARINPAATFIKAP